MIGLTQMKTLRVTEASEAYNAKIKADAELANKSTAEAKQACDREFFAFLDSLRVD